MYAVYLALRIAFDARLFGSMARGSITQLDHLDAALQRLRLRPAAFASRRIEDRIEGARRLVRTLLIVTHDDAYFHGADRLLRLDAGRIVADERHGTTALLPAPMAGDAT